MFHNKNYLCGKVLESKYGLWRGLLSEHVYERFVCDMGKWEDGGLGILDGVVRSFLGRNHGKRSSATSITSEKSKGIP